MFISPMDMAKAKTAAETTALLMRGASTVLKILHLPAPKVAAASPKRVLMFCIDGCRERKTKGKEMVAWAAIMINIPVRCTGRK